MPAGRWRLRVSTATPLLVALLAGCVGAEPGEDPGVEAVAPGPNARLSSFGSIEGHVLDSSFAPLPGAAVTLRDTGAVAATDGEGSFAFPGLPAGTYSLAAEKPGYQPAATRVAVRAAGVAAVNLFLERVPGPGPYTRVLGPFEGVIACAAGWSPVQSDNLCPGDANNKMEFAFDLEANLTALVLQVVWEARTDYTGKTLEVLWRAPAGIPRAAGTSPIRAVFQFDQEPFTANATEAVFTVRPAAGTQPTQGGDWGDAGGVAYQQPFTVYVTLFHLGQPVPEGYTARPDA